MVAFYTFIEHNKLIKRRIKMKMYFKNIMKTRYRLG